MLRVDLISTQQILEEVLKSKAAEKKAREGATGKLENKGNSDPFKKEGSIKM